MKKYKNDNAVFLEEIDIYERSDPSDADTVDNVPLKQLHDNTLVLKKGQVLATEETVKKIAEDCLNGTGISVEGAAVIGLPEESRVATPAEINDVKAKIGDILED